MVMSWLACPMPPSIRQSIMWIDSASEIWRDLCDLFSHGDKFRIADLQEELQNFRQGDLTVSQYYTRLRILWKELFMYRTIMACSYSTTCSCGILSKIQKERDDDCVIKFLRGLNDEFSQVRSQVMLMEPMPGLTRTFSLVLQQECEFGVEVDFLIIVAMVVLAKATVLVFTRFCTKCKKTNHTIDTCFQIYGFPPGYKTDGKNTSTTSKPSVNVVDTISPTTSNTSAQDDVKPQNNFSFSKDQYQALLALLQQSRTRIPPLMLIVLTFVL
ncbi:uncharacterized protein LOC109807083 [Cajanus cajan]|uniref:uncharacterized protein LOC109807083 n=1 Tax=Cajanus cajan TaxID=3821 RepID=UPI00098D9314|nr:uncharacterized protein LOC109807083 [Cajanus cajan]